MPFFTQLIQLAKAHQKSRNFNRKGKPICLRKNLIYESLSTSKITSQRTIMTVENQAKLAQSHYWRLQTTCFLLELYFLMTLNMCLSTGLWLTSCTQSNGRNVKFRVKGRIMLQKKKEKVISKYPNSYVHQNELLIYKYMTEMTESNIIETSTSSLEYWSTEIQ